MGIKTKRRTAKSTGTKWVPTSSPRRRTQNWRRAQPTSAEVKCTLQSTTNAEKVSWLKERLRKTSQWESPSTEASTTTKPRSSTSERAWAGSSCDGSQTIRTSSCKSSRKCWRRNWSKTTISTRRFIWNRPGSQSKTVGRNSSTSTAWNRRSNKPTKS